MSTSTIALIPPAPRDDSRTGAPLSRRAAVQGIGGGLTVIATLMAMPRIAKAGPEHAHPNPVESSVPEGVLGAWDVSFRRLDAAVDGGPERAIVSFAPDGEIQESSAPITVTPDGLVRFNSSGLGGWSAREVNTVVARYTVMIYDEVGTFAGKRAVTVTVQPDQENGTLAGAYESRHYDLTGELAEFAYGTIVAVPAPAR